MFTGIIEGLGTLRQIRSSGTGKRIRVDVDFSLDGAKIGDSIAVNGACLTAVHIEGSRFDVDVSPETISTTTLAAAKVGDRVNIERALRISDRIDGHLVSGHVDGLGKLEQKRKVGNAIWFAFTVPEALSRYMIHKGSVAVDGVSLTINGCDAAGFDVSVIPHTAQVTTLGLKKPGDAVNVETDLIGKYVERFVAAGKNGMDHTTPPGKPIDMALLGRTGFL